MAQNNISKLLQNKVENLEIEVENAQKELKKWQDITVDYNSNPEKFDLLATLLIAEAGEAKKTRKK